MQKRCCFIIDLDFTLVNLDTTEEFLKMLCPLKYSIFSKILKPAVILGRFFRIDLYKQLLLLLCIYGYSKRFLEEKAKIFFETLVSKGHINTLLLHSIQKNDCTKILLTASLDIIAIRFYDLGFDLVISSTSLFRHEKFIGIRDLYKNKHKIVYALSKLFQKVMIFEDSPEPEYRIVKNTKIISVFYGKNKVSSQTINRLIVAFSLIVFRIDAFMNNFIEYSFIITYLVGAFKCMNNQFPNLSELMFDIIIVNIVASLIYSIVYVINDFIDFNKVRNFKENFTKFSFYAIRPIIYFNRSIFILIYLIGLYFLYVYCTLIFFSTTTIFLIGVLILVSVVHSLLQDNIRPITFFMLRIIKYVLFLYLLSNVLPSLEGRDIFTISLPLIVPYTALQTYFYAVQKNVFSRQSYISILTKICILISTILTFLYVSLVVNSPQVVESIIVGYIAISPFLIIRSGLRKILGPEDRDFYVHIKRLSLATLLTTCVIFMVILILS